MRLLCVGRGRWTVLLTEQVLDELADWGSAKAPRNAMLSFISRTVPESGPQEGNATVCKPLRGTDHLFEFRKGDNRGAKVRVLWFYGDRARTQIVCALAFVKTFQKTPVDHIEATEEMKRLYGEAVAKGIVKIEDAVHLVRRKK